METADGLTASCSGLRPEEDAAPVLRRHRLVGVTAGSPLTAPAPAVKAAPALAAEGMLPPVAARGALARLRLRRLAALTAAVSAGDMLAPLALAARR